MIRCYPCVNYSLSYQKFEQKDSRLGIVDRIFWLFIRNFVESPLGENGIILRLTGLRTNVSCNRCRDMSFSNTSIFDDYIPVISDSIRIGDNFTIAGVPSCILSSSEQLTLKGDWSFRVTIKNYRDGDSSFIVNIASWFGT